MEVLLENQEVLEINFILYFKLVKHYNGQHYHFLVVRKDTVKKMDIVLVDRTDWYFSLDTGDVNCFYFCNHFLEALMKKSKIKNASTTTFIR